MVHKLDTYHEETFTIIPDALMEFQYSVPNGNTRRCVFLLEHDRGTEAHKYFRRRIRAYIVFFKTGAYKDLFQTPRITIAFTTFIGERRFQELRKWARQELAATKEPPAISQQLLFTCLPKIIDPRHLFFNPCWVRPFDVDRENQKTIHPISLLSLFGYGAKRTQEE